MFFGSHQLSIDSYPSFSCVVARAAWVHRRLRVLLVRSHRGLRVGGDRDRPCSTTIGAHLATTSPTLRGLVADWSNARARENVGPVANLISDRKPLFSLTSRVDVAHSAR